MPEKAVDLGKASHQVHSSPGHTAMTMLYSSSETSGAASPFFLLTWLYMSLTLQQATEFAQGRSMQSNLPQIGLHVHPRHQGAIAHGAMCARGSSIVQQHGTWTAERMLEHRAGHIQKSQGLKAHVSLKDFKVLLWRLETAIRAASCSTGPYGE